MKKVIQFPKPQATFGSIRDKRMRITCNACGNTEKFYGKAMVHPFIVIEQQSDTNYDVTEVGYRNSGNVEEVAEACASCGSHDIRIDILTKGAK